MLGLTPHGVSGLKLILLTGSVTKNLSHPAWGEWIEIPLLLALSFGLLSHPAWGEWIEICLKNVLETLQLSHPAWGEWIEIYDLRPQATATTVSPRMG